MNLEEIQRYIDKIINEQNNQGIPDFEGYSPFEMYQLLNFTFGSNSPIQLQKLCDNDYQKIPFLNQIKYLIDLIAKKGEMKLTSKGFLPTKIVSEIYSQGFLKEEYIERGISKLYKETDSITINLTRIIIEIAGLVKKRNKKLSLTKKGEKMVSDNDKLFREIFKTYTTKFNWTYYDGYGENQIGQLGFGFSLILLNRYGTKKRIDKFYADKYFIAFPDLIENEFSSSTVTGYKSSSNCYSLRTFDRFLDYFGLIKIEKVKKPGCIDKYITKTEIMDKLIKCLPIELNLEDSY
ncbi:MAG: hypothetical protein APR63_14790 [Desulfuromonas sp. SDB]|nr:MAG: hypothetical protein APR63_14790 [Desulfuromonas sp. SDB]